MIDVVLGIVAVISVLGLVFVVERNAVRSNETIKLLTQALKAKDLNELTINRKMEDEEDKPNVELGDIPIEHMDDNSYIGLIKKQLNKTENDDSI